MRVLHMQQPRMMEQVIGHKPMYMNDYVEQLNSVLSSSNRKLLIGSGKVSHDQALKKAKVEYKKYQEITIPPVEQAYMETIKDFLKNLEFLHFVMIAGGKCGSLNNK